MLFPLLRVACPAQIYRVSAQDVSKSSLQGFLIFSARPKFLFWYRPTLGVLVKVRFRPKQGFRLSESKLNYCDKLSHVLMDFGKIEPVFGGFDSISTKLWVWFLSKHTFQRVFLGYAKNQQLQAHSVIWILRNNLAILDPLVLSVHFWFTFGFGDCISILVTVRPKL